jgi:hypothetical protein
LPPPRPCLALLGQVGYAVLGGRENLVVTIPFQLHADARMRWVEFQKFSAQCFEAKVNTGSMANTMGLLDVKSSPLFRPRPCIFMWKCCLNFSFKGFDIVSCCWFVALLMPICSHNGRRATCSRAARNINTVPPRTCPPQVPPFAMHRMHLCSKPAPCLCV